MTGLQGYNELNKAVLCFIKIIDLSFINKTVSVYEQSISWVRMLYLSVRQTLDINTQCHIDKYWYCYSSMRCSEQIPFPRTRVTTSWPHMAALSVTWTELITNSCFLRVFFLNQSINVDIYGVVKTICTYAATLLFFWFNFHFSLVTVLMLWSSLGTKNIWLGLKCQFWSPQVGSLLVCNSTICHPSNIKAG